MSGGCSLRDDQYVEDMLQNMQIHFVLCAEEDCEVCRRMFDFFKEIEEEL